LINNSVEQYKNGIVVIHICLTKGMEYDVVLFADASIKNI